MQISDTSNSASGERFLPTFCGFLPTFRSSGQRTRVYDFVKVCSYEQKELYFCKQIEDESNGNSQSATLRHARRAAPMARGEPLPRAMLLGGDTSGQVPRMAGDTLHRGGGGGAMLRVDRLYTQATPRRKAGTTTLATTCQESLDRAEQATVPGARGARADDGGGKTGA